jgi:hypothetical protein
MPTDKAGKFHPNIQKAMASDKAAPPPADDMATAPEMEPAGGDAVMDDPDAMQALQMLHEKGYTPDQVMQAFSQLCGDSEMGGEMPPMHQSGY